MGDMSITVIYHAMSLTVLYTIVQSEEAFFNRYDIVSLAVTV